MRDYGKRAMSSLSLLLFMAVVAFPTTLFWVSSRLSSQKVRRFAVVVNVLMTSGLLILFVVSLSWIVDSF